MNKELIPIEELIKEIENNKYIDCDEVDKYEEIYEYGSILYYLKKYIRLNNIIDKAKEYIKEWQRFPHTNGSTHKELENLMKILDKELKENK